MMNGDMGSMMNSMMGWMLGIGLLGWVLVIALLVTLVVLLFRRVGSSKRDDRDSWRSDNSSGRPPQSTA
jgi:uncharacterized membrane protein